MPKLYAPDGAYGVKTHWVRIPDNLWARLADEAVADRRSVASLIVIALTAYVGEDQP